MIGENIFISIVKRALVIFAIGAVGILIFVSEPKSYIYGLLFGMVINILNFRLMSLSIKKAIKLDPNKAQRFTVGNYLVRYLIYGIVLYIAAVADYINLVTVVIGFFTVKLIIVSDAFYEQVKGKRKD